MKMKTGTAYLPLHYGTAPRWLFGQMVKLAREMTIILVGEFGAGEFLKRLSDPYWFQAFGCVLGFDWHSSGLTTTTCGAIKEGLKPLEKDLGIFVCGGKGKTSRKTPQEIQAKCRPFLGTTNANQLTYASKMAAKVDNNALQDGYQLYHHSFLFTREGKWAVIQQGMETTNRWARRYHWLSDSFTDFVNEPHAGIASQKKQIGSPVLNLVANESADNREISAKIAADSPEKNIRTFKKLQNAHLSYRHQLLISDINPEKIKKILLTTYERQPKAFEDLLGLPGVGAKTIRALSLIAELIWGAPASVKDPARFAYAHGGKDGYPYPVEQKTYQDSIAILQEAINKAHLGYYDKLHAFRRLASMVE